MTTNRNRWSIQEEAVLKTSIENYKSEGHGGLTKAYAETARILSRSERACSQHHYYMTNRHHSLRVQAQSRDFRKQVESYGITIRGKVVSINPKQGIKVIINS